MVRQVTTLPVTELPVAEGNWDATRAPIDRVIIHTMVGTTASANARFNTPYQASAHYGVSLDGSIVHWTDEDNTAYHAGNYPMNQRSIGIEHEDNGNYNGVRPDILYASSARLVKDICKFYNIPIDRNHILEHKQVSDQPTACPDALDINRIIREASIVPVHASSSVSPSISPSPSASLSVSRSESSSPSASPSAPPDEPSDPIPPAPSFFTIFINWLLKLFHII